MDTRVFANGKLVLDGNNQVWVRSNDRYDPSINEVKAIIGDRWFLNSTDKVVHTGRQQMACDHINFDSTVKSIVSVRNHLRILLENGQVWKMNHYVGWGMSSTHLVHQGIIHMWMLGIRSILKTSQGVARIMMIDQEGRILHSPNGWSKDDYRVLSEATTAKVLKISNNAVLYDDGMVRIIDHIKVEIPIVSSYQLPIPAIDISYNQGLFLLSESNVLYHYDKKTCQPLSERCPGLNDYNPIRLCALDSKSILSFEDISGRFYNLTKDYELVDAKIPL